jgi:hypothetical protein
VVGNKAHQNNVGPFGLGRRNQRGQMLIDFSERNGLDTTNTWFKKPKRRLYSYTWKSPGVKSRYQLDYALAKQRFKNSVKDVQTLPGADIDSGHNLLVATICTRLKFIRFHKRKPKWDLEKLCAQRQIVHDRLKEILGVIKCESGNVEVQWNSIKKCVLDTMSDLVGKVERRTRKPWITQEMISKMDE